MEAMSFEFAMSEEAKAKKTALIDRLSKDARVIAFLKANGLPKTMLQSHSGTFEQWLQTIDRCSQCKGLSFCLFHPKGHFLDLSYDGLLMYESKPCAYYKDERLRYAHQKRYEIMDFAKEDLCIDLRTLSLEEETKEYRDVVLHVLSHLQQEKQEKGIYLSGPPGVGKTYLCIGITNSFAKQGKRCVFVNVAHLISSLKRLFQDSDAMDELIQSIAKADVAVFDDIGGESVTAWSRDDVLLPLLDERMSAHRLTYFTSNYTMKELQEKYRAFSAKGNEPVAALRLLERVKALSEEKILKGRSRR